MYKYILFDLDGTITDSSKGITNCVKYALEAARWEIPENDRLLEFIGPPLTEGFMTISKMSEKKQKRQQQSSGRDIMLPDFLKMSRMMGSKKC